MAVCGGMHFCRRQLMLLNFFFRHWLVLSTLCVISCGSTRAQVDSTRLVTIDSGSISGALFGPSRQEVMFLGIPYAAPPTGDRRWKPPAPVENWKGVRKADAFAPACPQPANSVRAQAAEAKELSQKLPYYRTFERMRIVFISMFGRRFLPANKNSP